MFHPLDPSALLAPSTRSVAPGGILRITIRVAVRASLRSSQFLSAMRDTLVRTNSQQI